MTAPVFGSGDYTLICPGGKNARVDGDHSTSTKTALQHADGSVCTHGEPEVWAPTVQDGETPKDVPLVQWVGEALGAASTCWVGGTSHLTFDSTKAKAIYDALMARIEQALAETIERHSHHLCGYCGDDFDQDEKSCREHVRTHLSEMMGQVSTRHLLEELRKRGEAAEQARGAVAADGAVLAVFGSVGLRSCSFATLEAVRAK